jgi:hypothetical protein
MKALRTANQGRVTVNSLHAPCYKQVIVLRLLSSRYQDVFAYTACSVVMTRCCHLVTRLMTVTDLLQIVPTRLIQAVRNKLLRTCHHQHVITTCYVQTISDLLEQLVASLLASRHQPCYKMITACYRLVKNWEQAVRTHLVDKLWDFYACGGFTMY